MFFTRLGPDPSSTKEQLSLFFRSVCSSTLQFSSVFQDLPSAKSSGELEKYLALRDLGPGQLWHLEPACAVTGEGLDTALEAAHELVLKRRKQKKRTRNKTR